MLISYDVNTEDKAGRRRLRRIARTCQDYGFSVFECEISPAGWIELRARLLAAMDPAVDSLRFYNLGADGQRRIEHVGNKKPLDLDGPLLL